MNLTKLGDYEIVRRIGQGGMGAVYEGVNPNIGRRVAIKVLLPECANQADVVRRFWNEAKAVNAINHPGVVQISEVGTAADGSLYLVMEYLEGHTLSERLSKSQGKLAQEEVITISWQLAGVLAAAHGKNIIHRDLKPANIMIVPDLAGPGGERIKLLDFGIAKLGLEHLRDEDVKTRTGQMLGTAAYMSPEQFMANQPIDGQTDVYSLGIVMYRLLAGQLPFASTNGQMALGMMHLTEPPPALAERAPGTADWLIKLVHRMLAKPTGERPTMAQVMSELQEHLPLRQSSPSLRPLSKPGEASNTELVLHLQVSTDPSFKTAQVSQGSKSIGALQTQASDPETVALAASRGSGNHAAELSTFTGATGQRGIGAGRWSGRLVTFAALGFALLMIGVGFYLRAQLEPRATTSAAQPGPAAATSATAPPKAAAEVAAPSEPAKENRAEPAPIKAEPADATKSTTPTAASPDQGTKSGRGKAGRVPTSGKTAERKNDGKQRRTSKPPPTQILN